MAKRGTSKLSLSRGVIAGPKVGRKGGTNKVSQPHRKSRGYAGAGQGNKALPKNSFGKAMKKLHDQMGGPGMTHTNPAVPRAY